VITREDNGGPLGVISNRCHPAHSGTVSTTVKHTISFDPMSYDLATTVLAFRREPVDGALEAVERMRRASRSYLECEMVVIPAYFALSHDFLHPDLRPMR